MLVQNAARSGCLDLIDVWPNSDLECGLRQAFAGTPHECVAIERMDEVGWTEQATSLQNPLRRPERLVVRVYIVEPLPGHLLSSSEVSLVSWLGPEACG
jgi:hypothetical protein